MKQFPFLVFVLASTVALGCSSTEEQEQYRSLSRYTNPGEYAPMLAELPEGVVGICEIARQQTVHHNLRPYFEIPKEEWGEMIAVWPQGAPFPGVRGMLAALKERNPHNLYDERNVEDRIVSACMLESTLLTGMLRHKGYAARIRAGYFKYIMADSTHLIGFWEDVVGAKGIMAELREADPAGWKELMNDITRRDQILVDKHIEHWICEYWDQSEGKWRLLDANTTFLKASSGIEVGYHLPPKHFEFAHEAWQKMRKNVGFDTDQYAEFPQDGRSHIRSQLLLDYFSLLNHDMAGFEDQEGEVHRFIKQKNYEEASDIELMELDGLARLLTRAPTVEQLVDFYYQSKTLRIETAEKDRFSLVFP
jgi:hypothetical protein